jgi:hypothetical protein
MRLFLSGIKNRLQNYFHNNPKRIAFWWIFAHVTFLFFVLILFDVFSEIVSEGWSLRSFSLVFVMITGLPNYALGLIDLLHIREPNPSSVTPIIVGIVNTILYYSWFIAMCLVARDTRSKIFRVVHWIFTVWFLLCVLSIIFILFLSHFIGYSF